MASGDILEPKISKSVAILKMWAVFILGFMRNERHIFCFSPRHFFDVGAGAMGLNVYEAS